MSMAATRAKVSSLEALNRLTACPRCGSSDLTPAAPSNDLLDSLAELSRGKMGRSPMRKCTACGWLAEVAS
jgi:hypothetical protein